MSEGKNTNNIDLDYSKKAIEYYRKKGLDPLINVRGEN